MRKIGVAAAVALALVGVLGGLWAAGVFSGAGSSETVAAASQAQGVSQTQSQDNTSATGVNVWLGVQLVQGDDGPTIASVIADSPADKAGLQRGDVITAIDGTSVSNVREIRDALQDKAAGDTVTVSITRDGNAQDVTVTLEARPEAVLPSNPLVPELSGVPADELFSHLLGGSFQFTDADGNEHTASIELGTVTSVDVDAKTVTVDLNTGDSKHYTITDDVLGPASDLTQIEEGDQVTAISVDGDLRALMNCPGGGFPFFGGMRGFGIGMGMGGRHGFGPGGGEGFEGDFEFDGELPDLMPRGGGGGGF